MSDKDLSFSGWVRAGGRYTLSVTLVGMAGALVLGLFAGDWKPRKPEVVFVRTNDVMARYKGTIQAHDSFQKDTAAWAEESKQLEDKLKALGKTAKPTDSKALEQAREMANRLKSLRDKGAQHDQELMTPVLAEVNSGIKKFAKKHGYKLVVGTLQGGVILHGDENLDVTDALLQDLNQ